MKSHVGKILLRMRMVSSSDMILTVSHSEMVLLMGLSGELW